MTISERMSLSQKQEGAKSIPSRPFKRAWDYFEEIKAEFVKINWTEGEDVLNYARVVVICTFAFGLLIYVADLVVHRVLFGLDTLFKLIVG